MVVLGYDSTIPVTVEDMVHHTRPVARAARRALVLADLPFMSYTVSQEQALANAARLIQEGGAQAVKLEGGRAVAPVVAAMVESGIPVVGHLGLTPQSIHRFGGHRVQGRDQATAQRLVGDAHALEDAGASAIVLELVPSALAERITAALKIPTIGIGAGPGCDGQVQVMHDLLGFATPSDRVPRHAKLYADLGATIARRRRALRRRGARRHLPHRGQQLHHGGGACWPPLTPWTPSTPHTTLTSSRPVPFRVMVGQPPSKGWSCFWRGLL